MLGATISVIGLQPENPGLGEPAVAAFWLYQLLTGPAGLLAMYPDWILPAIFKKPLTDSLTLQLLLGAVLAYMQWFYFFPWVIRRVSDSIRKSLKM